MNLKVIYKLFIAEMFAQAVAIYTIYIIMFSDRGGLNLTQVGTILSIFALTTLIFEIPTGVIADKFSRKWSMFIARVLLAGGLLVWLLFPSFAGYTVGIILMGITESLMSGAIQAYLYESLGEDKKLFNKYNSRLWAAMMTGWLIGSGIASIFGPRYGLLLTISVVFPLISAAILLTLPADGIKDNKETTNLKLFVGAARYIKESRALIYAFFAIVTMKVIVDVIIEYVPLYYKAAGASTRVVPILFLVGNFITIFLFWHAHTLVHILKRKEVLTGVLFMMLLLTSRYLGTVPAIAGMFIYARYLRVFFVHLESEFQHLAVNRYRATLGSLYSMGSRLITAVSFVVIGYYSRKTSILTPLILFTLILYIAHRITFALSDRYQARHTD